MIRHLCDLETNIVSAERISEYIKCSQEVITCRLFILIQIIMCYFRSRSLIYNCRTICIISSHIWTWGGGGGVNFKISDGPLLIVFILLQFTYFSLWFYSYITFKYCATLFQNNYNYMDFYL